MHSSTITLIGECDVLVNPSDSIIRQMLNISVETKFIVLYCSLLALQFGLQPILTDTFVNKLRPEGLRPSKVCLFRWLIGWLDVIYTNARCHSFIHSFYYVFLMHRYYFIRFYSFFHHFSALSMHLY